MKLTDLLSLSSVTVDLKATTKTEIIDELVDLLIVSGTVDKKHKKKILEFLMAREALGSTAIGQGIAIPHAKCEFIKELVGCLGISRQGIDFESLDGEPVYIFFLLLAPVDSAGPHLKALARISRLLKDKFVRESLKSVKDSETLLEIVRREDGRLSKI